MTTSGVRYLPLAALKKAGSSRDFDDPKLRIEWCIGHFGATRLNEIIDMGLAYEQRKAKRAAAKPGGKK